MAKNGSEPAAKLGAAMRALRERTGLSQAQVASRMGLSATAQTQLGRYERGERIPRVDTLKRYLDAVEARFADLETFLGSAEGERSKKLSKRALELTRELSRIS